MLLWQMRGRRSRKILFWGCIFGGCALVQESGGSEKAWRSWDLKGEVNEVTGRTGAKALWWEGSCWVWGMNIGSLWLEQREQGQNEVHGAGRRQTVPGHTGHIKESCLFPDPQRSLFFITWRAMFWKPLLFISFCTVIVFSSLFSVVS